MPSPSSPDAGQPPFDAPAVVAGGAAPAQRADAAPRSTRAGRGDVSRFAPPAAPALCYLSLVVPAFNEEKRLPATLGRIVEYLAERDFSYEIIVVDDGSQDGTRQVVTQFARQFESGGFESGGGKNAARNVRGAVRLEGYDDGDGAPQNKGKGAAVRHGVLAARGRDIAFSDADLSTPIEELEKLLPPLSRGDCDITIASRGLAESYLAVHQPWHRECIGRAGNKLVRRVLDIPIADTQCGFKAFRGEVAKKLFGLSQIDGFGFDFEVLFLAQKFGCRVREIPVTWKDVEGSRLNPVTAPLQALGELFQVRLNDVRGLYDIDD